MATDPVCGMTVPSDGRFRHLHDGQTYLFCSAKAYQVSIISYGLPQAAQRIKKDMPPAAAPKEYTGQQVNSLRRSDHGQT